jgi:hypothetical protein
MQHNCFYICFLSDLMKLLKLNLDHLGMTASTLCAVHCALVPLMITVLPLFGLGFLANNAVEITMIIISLLLGIWSLGVSYRNQHKKLLPVLILIMGFLLIGAGHFIGVESLEPILIPIGGFTIAGAHLVNMRYIRSCMIAHQHHSDPKPHKSIK